MKNIIIWSLILLCSAAEAHQLKVAIIDTGLNLEDPRFKSILCDSGHVDYTGEGIQDDIGHGTHIAGLIKRYAAGAKYCLIIIKFYTPNYAHNAALEIKAIRHAIDEKADIVNISAGGERFALEEYKLITASPKVRFVVAAGNSAKNLTACKFYPASYQLPNIIVVGSRSKDGKISSFSNYGKNVKKWEIGEQLSSTLPKGTGVMSGTSQATAVRTGKLIRELYARRN